MTTYLLALFTTAIELTGHHRMMLMLPLCLSVAIVYKAMRCEDLSRLRRESLVLWGNDRWRHAGCRRFALGGVLHSDLMADPALHRCTDL